MRFVLSLVTAACLTALLIAPAATVAASVTEVANPAEPSQGSVVVDAVEDWRLGGDDEEGAFFGVVGDVVVDGERQIYFLDLQLAEIQVYDTDGIYLRTIGHEGEGPGEFRRPVRMFQTATGDMGVIQRMPGNIVLLTREGDPAGQVELTEPEGGGRRFFQDGGQAGGNVMILSMEPKRDGGGMTLGMTLAAYDPEGNEVGRYMQTNRTMDFANPILREQEIGRPVWAADESGVAYLVTTFGEYEIGRFDPDGTQTAVSRREYESLPRTQGEKEEFKGRIRFGGRRMQPTIEVSDNHPDVASLHPRPDGSLWVLTSRGAEKRDGVIGVFDVYDAGGHFVKEVTVRGEGDARGDGLFFRGDRLYVVRHMLSGMRSMMAGGPGAPEPVDTDEDEDAAPIEVICYTVPPLDPAK